MINVVKNDIHITNKLCSEKPTKHGFINQYGVFKTIYPFSNEDLINCFNNFDFANKRILTVLASSDQVIDMYLRGACRVDSFDINRLTRYYYYLKLSTLRYDFPIEFFIDFLNTHNSYNPYYMGKHTFNKIKSNLSNSSKMYWDYIFDNYTSDEISNYIFSHDASNNDDLKSKILYLNSKDNYDKAKKIANDIQFIPSDVKMIRNKVSGPYDYIYLSNIMQYACEMYMTDSYIKALKRYKNMMERLSCKLDYNGKIINYIFNSKLIEKRDAINIIFDSTNYQYTEINDTDAILVYKKNANY